MKNLTRICAATLTCAAALSGLSLVPASALSLCGDPAQVQASITAAVNADPAVRTADAAVVAATAAFNKAKLAATIATSNSIAADARTAAALKAWQAARVAYYTALATKTKADDAPTLARYRAAATKLTALKAASDKTTAAKTAALAAQTKAEVVLKAAQAKDVAVRATTRSRIVASAVPCAATDAALVGTPVYEYRGRYAAKISFLPSDSDLPLGWSWGIVDAVSEELAPVSVTESAPVNGKVTLNLSGLSGGKKYVFKVAALSEEGQMMGTSAPVTVDLSKMMAPDTNTVVSGSWFPNFALPRDTNFDPLTVSLDYFVPGSTVLVKVDGTQVASVKVGSNGTAVVPATTLMPANFSASPAGVVHNVHTVGKQIGTTVAVERDVAPFEAFSGPVPTVVATKDPAAVGLAAKYGTKIFTFTAPSAYTSQLSVRCTSLVSPTVIAIGSVATQNDPWDGFNFRYVPSAHASGYLAPTSGGNVCRLVANSVPVSAPFTLPAS